MKKEIKINVLGAGQEFGRNCFILTYPTGEMFLLDCGLDAGGSDNSYPLFMNRLRLVNLAFLSHPHLDHVGAFPAGYKHGLSSDIIIPNNIAREVSQVILLDSFKLEKERNGSSSYDIGHIKQTINQMKVQQSGKYGNVSFKLIATSHIPCGVSILLEHPDTKSVLYTGDIKMSKTQLMKARSILPHADVMFVDSTYGDKIHPNRKKTEKEFERIITETIRKEGRVVVPCFSVARSQEILILLHRISKKLKVPVYLDGMGRSITEIYLKYPEELDNPKFIQAIKNVIFIKTEEDRKRALSGPAIIVPSGGMADSPLVKMYIKSIAPDKNSAIILTGYQAEDSGGFDLITNGKIFIEFEEIKPECPIFHLNFSSHSDRKESKGLIKMVNPGTVIATHGEAAGINGIIDISNQLGIEALAPMTGETIFV
jgi:putative mRNA 3-end processing factor